MNEGERIAVVETKVENIEFTLKTVLEKQEEMMKQLTKYKGFIGGIFFVFSSMATLIALGFDAIRIKLGMK